MVPVSGPTSVACTSLSATAGMVLTTTLAVGEVAGHPCGQGCCPPPALRTRSRKAGTRLRRREKMRLHAPFPRQAVDQRKDAGFDVIRNPVPSPALQRSAKNPRRLGRDEHMALELGTASFTISTRSERVRPDRHVGDRSCHRVRNPRLVSRYRACLDWGMIRDLPRPLVLWRAVWFFASLGCGPTNTGVSPGGGGGPELILGAHTRGDRGCAADALGDSRRSQIRRRGFSSISFDRPRRMELVRVPTSA